MAEGLTILFTCAGRRVSLMRAFRRAMDDLGLEGRVLAADWSPLAPAFHLADEGFLVPGVNLPEYVETLLEICRRQGVGLVIPLIDWELHRLAPARERFAEAGARLVVSSTRVTEICRDKKETFEFLQAQGVDTPRVLSLAEARRGPFPVIAKARFGSSAHNVRRIGSPGGLRGLRRGGEDTVIQEFVRGPEFTVDVYASFDGRPRVAVPRRRIQVRAGEVSRARTVRNERIVGESLRLVEALGECMGVITCQCRLTDDEEVKFFDLNPRFGGGVPLAIRAGADFPRWIIQEHLGRDPQIDPDAWEDGLTMLRYDAEVYLTREELAEAGGGNDTPDGL